MDFLRRMVAGTRRRFEEEGYSLDLTYIIPKRIIAMSYPSNSFESLYRNPIDKVCDLSIDSINQKDKIS